MKVSGKLPEYCNEAVAHLLDQQEIRGTMPLTGYPAGVESWLCPLHLASPHALACRGQTTAENHPPAIMSLFHDVVLT